MTRAASDPSSKTALLRTAEKVFVERGFAATTAADIAASAGVPVEAFYLHFDSTDAALQHIVEGWLERCKSLFASPGEYPDATSEPDALVDFCIERDVQIYEFLWETRPTMRVVHECRERYGHVYGSFREEIRRRNREWLGMWRQDGLFRPETNIEIAAVLMSGAHDELSTKMMRSESRPPIEEWLQFTLDTFLRAWGTPDLIAALDRRSRRVNTGVHRSAFARHSAA